MITCCCNKGNDVRTFFLNGSTYIQKFIKGCRFLSNTTFLENSLIIGNAFRLNIKRHCYKFTIKGLNVKRFLRDSIQNRIILCLPVFKNRIQIHRSTHHMYLTWQGCSCCTYIRCCSGCYSSQINLCKIVPRQKSDLDIRTDFLSNLLADLSHGSFISICIRAPDHIPEFNCFFFTAFSIAFISIALCCILSFRFRSSRRISLSACSKHCCDHTRCHN